MIDLMYIVHTLVCLGLIGFILLQQGKGADMGAALGAGASQSLFGAQGSANFLSRSTAFLATCFFITCLGLTLLVNQQVKSMGIMNQMSESQPVNGPVESLPIVPENKAADNNSLPVMPQ